MASKIAKALIGGMYFLSIAVQCVLKFIFLFILNFVVLWVINKKSCRQLEVQWHYGKRQIHGRGFKQGRPVQCKFRSCHRCPVYTSSKLEVHHAPWYFRVSWGKERTITSWPSLPSLHSPPFTIYSTCRHVKQNGTFWTSYCLCIYHFIDRYANYFLQLTMIGREL